jgi:tetratricopeptide (TPR) repeat protein
MRNTLYFLTSILFFGYTSLGNAQNVNEGRRLTRNEQYEDAEKIFNALIAAKPKVGDPYYYAGINYLQRKDSNAAQSIFDKGLVNSPKFTLNQVGKGHLLLRQGKAAEAEAVFALALKTKKKLLMGVNKEIARAYLMVTDAPRTQLVAYATKALEYLNKADNINDNEVQMLIGDAYAVISPLDLGRAVEQYLTSSSKNSQDPLPRLREALVYQKAKNYETAMERINQALTLDKDFAPAYRQKAELFAEMGNAYKEKKYRDSAVYFYRAYLQRNNNLSARRMFVQSLFFNQQYDDCIQEGLKIQNETETPNIWGIMAYATVQKNDTSRLVNQKGLEYFDKYEEKHVKPQNRGLSVTERYYKSILLFRTNSKDAGFALLKSALTDTAKTVLPWYDQGFDLVFKWNGHFNEALSILDLKELKAGRLTNKDLFYKAQCYNRLNRPLDAIDVYKSIIARDSAYFRGYYLIAQNWKKIDPKDSTGNVTKAFEEWFVKMTPADRETNKKDIEYAYRDLASITYNKGNKVYMLPEEKASGYTKCKELYAKSIEYYKKVIEFNPADVADVKAQLESVEQWMNGLGKSKPKPKKK